MQGFAGEGCVDSRTIFYRNQYTDPEDLQQHLLLFRNAAEKGELEELLASDKIDTESLPLDDQELLSLYKKDPACFYSRISCEIKFLTKQIEPDQLYELRFDYAF